MPVHILGVWFGSDLHLCKYRKAIRRLSRSNDLSWPRKVLYKELVEGSVLDPIEKHLGLSLGEICSQRNWTPGSGFLNNSRLECVTTFWLGLQSRLDRYAWFFSLQQRYGGNSRTCLLPVLVGLPVLGSSWRGDSKQYRLTLVTS